MGTPVKALAVPSLTSSASRHGAHPSFLEVRAPVTFSSRAVVPVPSFYHLYKLRRRNRSARKKPVGGCEPRCLHIPAFLPGLCLGLPIRLSLVYFPLLGILSGTLSFYLCISTLLCTLLAKPLCWIRPRVCIAWTNTQTTKHYWRKS